MVAKVGREAFWLDVAPATLHRPHAPKAEHAAKQEPAPEVVAAQPQAATATPESEAWAALLAHSQGTVSALANLAESLQAVSPPPESSAGVPGGMTVEDGRVTNRAGHAPRGLNRPDRPGSVSAQGQAPATAPPPAPASASAPTPAPAAQSGAESTVTGSETGTTDPAPAATASAAAGSGQPAHDFPWPGWPRAPRPRTEHAGQPWRPFAVPISPVQPEPQPAA